MLDDLGSVSPERKRLPDFVDELTELFYSHKLQRRSSLPISDLSLCEAYEIQDAVIRRRLEMGEHSVGSKAGCTSRAIRGQFGLTEPVTARIMAPHVHFGDAELDLGRFVNCAVEAELVFRIGEDITQEFLSGNRDIRDAIETVSPGIEVHNYKFWYGEPSAQELIASNAIHAFLVVGEETKRPGQVDLELEGIGLFLDGKLATSAISAETMGSPLNSLKWLASHLLSRGSCVRAGDLILPGSAVPLVTVEQGTVVNARFTRCGNVQARFS